MATAKDNLPATIDNYAIMKADPETLGAVIRENVGDGALNQFDLDRIKVPSGGGTTWTVPTLDGEEDMKELVGVIVFWRTVRAYWRDSFDASGGGTPPDCSSDDGVFGRGDPGGECAKCPFAQFGSEIRGDKAGRGQACKQMRLLFMIREGDMLPIVIACPPTSLKAISRYFLRLSSKGVPYHGVVTRLTLVKTKNADGIQYAQIEPGFVAQLPPTVAEKMAAYRASLTPALEAVRASEEDYSAAA